MEVALTSFPDKVQKVILEYLEAMIQAVIPAAFPSNIFQLDSSDDGVVLYGYQHWEGDSVSTWYRWLSIPTFPYIEKCPSMPPISFDLSNYSWHRDCICWSKGDCYLLATNCALRTPVIIQISLLTKRIVKNIPLPKEYSYLAASGMKVYEDKCYILDYKENRVLIFDLKQKRFTGLFDTIYAPKGITISDDVLYVADTLFSLIYMIDLKTLQPTSIRADKYIKLPNHIYVQNELIYVISQNEVVILNKNGKFIQSMDFAKNALQSCTVFNGKLFATTQSAMFVLATTS